MPTRELRGKVAVTGVGLSEIGSVPGWSEIELLAQAVSRALADAGIQKSEVDGVFATIESASLPAAAVCEYIGLRPKVVEGTMLGGSSFVNFLQWAALALDAGLCDVALIAYGGAARSGSVRIGGTVPIPYESPYGAKLVTSYALAAARHMHEFGTRREDLAEVAVAARAWAALNPLATNRTLLSVPDVLSARAVSDPLGVLDCCLISDGGGAVVMTRADRARHGRKAPAYLLGVAAEVSHQQISQMPDLTVTAAARSGPRAFAQAGLVPADVDVLQLYDAFTISPILFLEDLGFCPKGEGGRFVSNGRIAPGGALPVNTNGGGLSCMHPGMYGIFTVIESVVQLRHEAGARQVQGAEIALAHGSGGALSTQVTAIFGNEATV